MDRDFLNIAQQFLDQTGLQKFYELIQGKFALKTQINTDYNNLSNKPSINNVQLDSNKNTSDLNISYNDLQNKPTIATKVSELQNDSKFQTDKQVETAISNAIEGITQLEYVPVEELPPSGEKGKIYLITVAGGDGQNIYEEYIWIDNKYELLGTVQLKLSAIPDETIENIVNGV